MVSKSPAYNYPHTAEPYKNFEPAVIILEAIDMARICGMDTLSTAD